MKSLISAFVVLAMVAGGLYSGLNGGENPQNQQQSKKVIEKSVNKESKEPGSFRAGMLEYGVAERIVDGDTFVALIGSEKVRVRLIGVNAPELASNRYGKTKAAEPYSAEAKENLENKILGKKIILETDKGDKDRYGRSLRYLYLDDKGKKGEFINEQMLKEGYGRTMFYSPNTSMKERFLKLEDEAKVKKQGLWGK